MAQLKFKDFESLKRSIYVVAAEQADHFKALFHILDALGYAWANNCYHLGYGMILIKGGKLKSREGITADADQTIDLLEEMAYDEVHKRNSDLPEAEKGERAGKIAISALKWDFLKVHALKNINFDPESSLSLKGDTGPYLLYTYARTRSLLRKAGVSVEELKVDELQPSQVVAQEREMAALLHHFPDVVVKSVHSYNFSSLCAYLYSLANKFNAYYHDHRILDAPEDISMHRLALAAATGITIKSGLGILGIETLEEI